MPSTIMAYGIAIGVSAGAIILWVVFTRQRLVVLDENINNAMSQIGVQLFSRFNSLTALLEITKRYAGQESETLLETVKSGRSAITAKSAPEDVLRQEGIIDGAMGEIARISKQYPELRANENYGRTLDAVETFENMVRTSRLIYNDGVTKLNREIRMLPLPVSFIAGMLGFSKRNYI